MSNSSGWVYPIPLPLPSPPVWGLVLCFLLRLRLPVRERLCHSLCGCRGLRVFLEGDNKLLVNGRDLCCGSLDGGRESHDGGRELRDGLAVNCCGRRQFLDGIHRVLVELPIVRVCGGVVWRFVGGNRLVLWR